MNEAIGTSNPWKTTAKVLVAVLVLLVMALVSMLQPAPSTEGSSPAVHPGVHAMSAGGQGFAENLTSSATPKWLQATNRATLAVPHHEGRESRGSGALPAPSFLPRNVGRNKEETR